MPLAPCHGVTEGSTYVDVVPLAIVEHGLITKQATSMVKTIHDEALGVALGVIVCDFNARLVVVVVHSEEEGITRPRTEGKGLEECRACIAVEVP